MKSIANLFGTLQGPTPTPRRSPCTLPHTEFPLQPDPFGTAESGWRRRLAPQFLRHDPADEELSPPVLLRPRFPKAAEAL